MLRLLINNKNFRLFWLASSISIIGDFVDDIAFAQLVYTVTESTLLSSYVFAIKIVCSFLSVFTATIVDRYPKKNIIIVASLFQGTTLLLVFMLCCLNAVNMVILMIMATIQSVFSSFVTPARNAIILKIVDKQEIINARASLSIVASIIKLCSYAFSSVLIILIGINFAILLDAITFFISAVLLLGIRICDIKENVVNSFFLDVKEGFKFILSNKVILAVVFVTFIGNAATAPVDALLPAYIQQNSFPLWAYSTFMMATSIGGLIGGYITSLIQNKIKINYNLGIGFFIGVVGLILFGIADTAVFTLAGVLIGISIGIVSVMNSVIIQMHAPENMQARAFSFFSCISYIACPLGMIIAGRIGEEHPMRFVFPLFGTVLIIASICSILLIKDKIEKN